MLLSFVSLEVDELLLEERVDTTSSGVSEMINGITQDQLTTTAHCDTGGVQMNNLHSNKTKLVLAFISLPF